MTGKRQGEAHRKRERMEGLIINREVEEGNRKSVRADESLSLIKEEMKKNTARTDLCEQMKV
jgi:hypothetical protein